MMPPRYRITLLALTLGGLALAGCSGQSSTHPTTPTHTTTATSASPSGAASGARAPSTGAAKAPAAPTGKALPESTGIPACDDYLSSYVACHQAAAIYAPTDIESHYEAMRTSLLRDSQDPTVRPQLGARCTALATQLRQALHGKSCASGSPASSSSTP
ncbi:hypothetical protein [Dyella silvae]|uniref:hypothetical protein n=1 Tax=Dyella silvae TaxID=2994424 RepID=UPI0022651418|nr:hypothetical protein [Dyella silvae]